MTLDLITQEIGEGRAKGPVQFTDDHLRLGRRERRTTCNQGLASPHDNSLAHLFDSCVQ
jgi:hypothetical protein